jgi:hypothetical protein
MKVSMEIDKNFGYEKITQLVDNIPLMSSLLIFKCPMSQGTNIRYSTIKQKKRPVLDITGFFFRMSTWVREVRNLSTNAEKETRYIQYGQLLLFQ